MTRLISYIHVTKDHGQFCLGGDQDNNCKIGLCQGTSYVGDLHEPKSTSRCVLCMFGHRTFAPISWMCKKQTAVLVDRTPTHNTHLCSTVCSQARNASAWLKSHGLHFIFVRLKRFCHLVCTCLTLCCSPTCRLPRAHHLPLSLFLLPLHKNTQHNWLNMVTSKTTQYIMNISKLSRSTSSAIKRHSDMKTCRGRKPAHDNSHSSSKQYRRGRHHLPRCGMRATLNA